MELLPDFTRPDWFLIGTLVIFLVVVGRYLLIAGIFHAIFYIWYPERWKKRKLNYRSLKKNQLRKEIGWSMLTSLIFGLFGAIMLVLWQNGWLKVYIDIFQYPLAWLPCSLIISLFLHETYYYWLHRWMHKPTVFKSIHRVHHESNITSPWTAFSFHPAEGILQALFLPVLLLVMPMHLYVLLFQLTIMTFSSVVNHLDIEIYPKRFNRNAIGKWLIGATHHSLHHRQFKTNYGLYFTFWDKWKKTENENYHELFEEKTCGDHKTGVKAID